MYSARPGRVRSCRWRRRRRWPARRRRARRAARGRDRAAWHPRAAGRPIRRPPAPGRKRRLPAVRQFGRERDVLRADRRDRDRDAVPYRVVDQLQRLAQAGAFAGRQRHGVVTSGVGQRLAPPDLAADLDRLPGPADRRVEGHTVEALDDLRPGGAYPQLEAAVGQVVQAGCGHRQQGGGARVELQDPGRDMRAAGPGGDVAQAADRVEAVQFGHGNQLDAGLLVVGQLGGALSEAASRGGAAARATCAARIRVARVRVRACAARAPAAGAAHSGRSGRDPDAHAHHPPLARTAP